MLTFSRESVKDVWDELLPLGAARWAEAGETTPFAPSREDYIGLDAFGAIRVYTAREDGVLVGCGAFVLDARFSMDGGVKATQLVFFVVPEARTQGVGRNLLRYAEASLQSEGVTTVQHSCRTSDFAFLDMLVDDHGYALIGPILSKRL
jgi:GNAT superfamily N-acetyltransferase